MESMNLMRGFGGERADQVIPGALDWLERRGKADDWFLHVHLWDPHTPYRTPEDYGNPFESDPVPAWHTEDVRMANWDLSCLLYTSPSPRDMRRSRMPSSA